MKSPRHDFKSFFIFEADDFMEVHSLTQDLGIKV